MSIVTTTLNDESGDGKPIEVKISNSPIGLCIGLDGFSDYVSRDDKGIPILIEQWEGKVFMRVYADINSEEPTHSIDLSGALNTARN